MRRAKRCDHKANGLPRAALRATLASSRCSTLTPMANLIGYISSLASELKSQNQNLLFAMNAGMFDENQRPIGLYIEDGVQSKKLNRRAGGGNFHLKPNGVFYVKDGKPAVVETEAFAKSGVKPDFATQSGPMLVINGKIHPKFSPTGTSRKLRNGVGIDDKGTVTFVISENAVTFWEFASLFKDDLASRNALFFDGSVSSLYAPGRQSQ